MHHDDPYKTLAEKREGRMRGDDTAITSAHLGKRVESDVQSTPREPVPSLDEKRAKRADVTGDEPAVDEPEDGKSSKKK